jgi:sugar phosphate isomerase/epimerase
MRYGAMNFPIRPVLDEIHSIGALGFDYLELAMDPPEAHWETLRQERGAIREALDHYGMGLVCHLPTFVHTADLTASIREASRHEVDQALIVASELGAEKVVLHPSFVGGLGRSVPDLVRRYALESLDAIARQATAWGSRICLENLFDRLTPFSTIQEFEAIFERWPQLAMTIDVGHAFIDGRGMAHVLDLIRVFGDRLGHVHISDNLGRRDDHLAVGDGDINFRVLISALQRIAYDDTITLEIFTEDRFDLVRSREALQALMGSD